MVGRPLARLAAIFPLNSALDTRPVTRHPLVPVNPPPPPALPQRYSAAEAVRLVLRHRVTALIAVPAMMEDAVAVLEADKASETSGGSGGGGGGGGAGAGAAAAAGGGAASVDSVERVLERGGGDINRGGSCGAGGSGGGAWAGVGVAGEVVTRGPHVMAGYWRDPLQTRQVGGPGRAPASARGFAGLVCA